MSDDPRSTMIQDGNIMRIENALVEETFCFNDSSGYIIVSYSVPGELIITVFLLKLSLKSIHSDRMCVPAVFRRECGLMSSFLPA